MTDISQEEWHFRCYGASQDAMKALKPFVGKSSQDWSMLVMSILSDAQELLERDRANEARQLMNRAKWVISREWMGFKEEESEDVHR